MKTKDGFSFWKNVRDQIDATIAKKAKSEIHYHRTVYTGERGPGEYVVLKNGLEIPYTEKQESVLKKALLYRFEGKGDPIEIETELKKTVLKSM